MIGRLARDERGAAVVEFAFVLPIFLVLIAGLYDGARFLNAMLQVRAAAQAGAGWAAANGWDSSGIAAAVTAGSPLRAAASPAPALMSSVCAQGTGFTAPGPKGCPGGEPVGSFVVVNAQLAFTPMAPGFTGVWPANVNAQAAVRVQ
jgi:Flp pilus assembly protein TadG